ncbi:PTS transporter subunit EIIB [Vibrio splendidus]|uniref:PTS transporter subunit EIIB n=1 Tax=Vibrio splendidus TaxID=29497 RepID=UPI000C81A9C2|nr:PTS glucose/sucrose transporter subunit IIB [Vibrio splendidus]PMG18486.1 PTS glucose transporter subunit IIB [Vibrio splendidus]
MKIKTPLKQLFRLITQINPNTEQDVEIILDSLGGIDNVLETGACTTRLRLTLQTTSLVNKKALKQHGAYGVIILDEHNIQIVYGLKANTYSQLIEQRKKCHPS